MVALGAGLRHNEAGWSKGIVATAISECSVARVTGWGACARGGVQGREYTVVRARAQGRAERQGESAAVVILPGRNRQFTGVGGTRRRSDAGFDWPVIFGEYNQYGILTLQYPFDTTTAREIKKGFTPKIRSPITFNYGIELSSNLVQSARLSKTRAN